VFHGHPSFWLVPKKISFGGQDFYLTEHTTMWYQVKYFPIRLKNQEIFMIYGAPG
jgi:hypothetical protein